MTVHEVAKHGFGSEAETYERSRPSYPPEAVDWLVDELRIQPGATVVDLAAGTGKLTRLLEPTGADLMAVEPVEGMRTVLAQVLPQVPVIAGAAEALPFRADALDAMTVAQAFHWFDAGPAFAEFARVLRPGGRVGIVWNARDRSVDWVDRVWAIMDRVEKRAPWREHDASSGSGRTSAHPSAYSTLTPHWRDSALGDRTGFGPMHAVTFHHAQTLTPELVVDRFRAVSHVAVLPEAQREAVLDEIREVLTSHPDTRHRTELAIPYRLDGYWCERV